MANKLDVIVFGATGFTGKYVLLVAWTLFKNISWGVAGRNEKKLKDRLHKTGKQSKISDPDSIPIILANIEDEATIKKMTAQAKVIINCCGPCDLYGGEIVIKSCIETGCHYIDISSEGLFIANILLKYRKFAEEKGIHVVNACGVHTVLHDLGTCFIENNFKGTLNSLETYLYLPRIKGPTGNYPSWESAVNIMSKYRKLKALKEELRETQISGLKPKLTARIPHRAQNGWALSLSGIDADIIRRSQMYFYEHANKRPVQVINYSMVSSIQSLMVYALLGLLSIILAQFVRGRRLLLKFPEFFSFGIFTHGSPSEVELNKTRFDMVFRGKGWSDKLPSPDHEYQTMPNKEIIGQISGDNPTYGFTGLAVATCALVMILEPHNLHPRGGVWTPAIAFSRTSLIEQLKNNGVNFEIISVKDVC